MSQPISKGTAKSDIVVLPNDTNHYGNIFGGALLSYMDRTAFIAARKYAENDLVTVALNDMVFKAPVKVGETAEISAKVCYVGKTSLDVCVTVTSGEKKIVDNAKFVFVSVDASGKPTPIAQPSFANDEERAEFETCVKEREALNACKMQGAKRL